MNLRILLIAALVAAPAAAFAQPGPDGAPSKLRAPGPPMYGPGAMPHRPPMHHGPAMRPMPHRPPPPVAYPDYRRYQRGERLPPGLRGSQYVVQDWRGHGLRPPPRGYHWVQNGSDYVLAAIATGVISAVVINALTQ